MKTRGVQAEALVASDKTYGMWAEASWSSRASGAGEKCRRPGSVARTREGGKEGVRMGPGSGCEQAGGEGHTCTHTRAHTRAHTHAHTHTHTHTHAHAVHTHAPLHRSFLGERGFHTPLGRLGQEHVAVAKDVLLQVCVCVCGGGGRGGGCKYQPV